MNVLSSLAAASLGPRSTVVNFCRQKAMSDTLASKATRYEKILTSVPTGVLDLEGAQATNSVHGLVGDVEDDCGLSLDALGVSFRCRGWEQRQQILDDWQDVLLLKVLGEDVDLPGNLRCQRSVGVAVLVLDLAADSSED